MQSTCGSIERRRRVAGTGSVPALHCSDVGRPAGEGNLKVRHTCIVGGELELGLAVSQQSSRQLQDVLGVVAGDLRPVEAHHLDLVPHRPQLYVDGAWGTGS